MAVVCEETMPHAFENLCKQYGVVLCLNYSMHRFGDVLSQLVFLRAFAVAFASLFDFSCGFAAAVFLPILDDTMQLSRFVCAMQITKAT